MKKTILLIVLAILTVGSSGVSAQAPTDTITSQTKLEQQTSKKKKPTKEEKQRIKDLNSVVKTAKYKYTKEEKKQIDKLTILEQDLNDWIKDEQAEWFCVGLVELHTIPLFGGGDLTTTSRLDRNTVAEENGNAPMNKYGAKHKPIDTDVSYTNFKYENVKNEAELWIKQGSRLHARVYHKGDWYDGQRWITVFENGNTYKWRTKGFGLTTYVFNIPDGIIYDDSVLHPEYKEYNPWEYLIELDRQAGKFSQAELEKEMNAVRKSAQKARKEEKKREKEQQKALKRAAKEKK